MKVVIDDCRLERMDAYTDPLNDKIKRQAAEITRLLAENAELKGLNSTICDVCKHDEFLKETRELARAEGQEEAWELAQKIFGSEENIGYKIHQLNEIFDEDWDFTKIAGMSYQEAAAKVAEYERQKEEICVGDVVTFYGKFGLVTCIDDKVRGITENGLNFSVFKKSCTKTGRHIDVNAWMAQIGDER